LQVSLFTIKCNKDSAEERPAARGRLMFHKKVLIVDDDQEFLEELKGMFSLNGYRTVITNNSSSATDLAILEKPGVILLDLRMPSKR